MSKVRITRLMEYEFDGIEQALAAMESWAVPSNGARHFGSSNKTTTIRSAVIGPVYGELAERIHTAIPSTEEDDSDIFGVSQVIHDDLVRRARDLVAALDERTPSGALAWPKINLYRDRLRHWLQTYNRDGLPDLDTTEVNLLDAPEGTAQVVLFKDTGKYYTQEPWRIPEGAEGPWSMKDSPDFRRIGDGAILVPSQRPWGFPHLLERC